MLFSLTIVWVSLLSFDAVCLTLIHFLVGVGQSDKPDGINVVQSGTEVEILHQFIQMLRSSNKYSKVVGIGHSYGS